MTFFKWFRGEMWRIYSLGEISFIDLRSHTKSFLPSYVLYYIKNNK